MFIIFIPRILLTVLYAKETTKKGMRIDIKRCNAMILIIMENWEQIKSLIEIVK